MSRGSRAQVQSPEVLKRSLADEADAAKGSGQVGHYTPLAPAYLKNVSDILNGLPVSAFIFIDKTKHAAIRAETNLDDLTASFDDMAGAGAREIKFPNGLYHFSDVEIVTNYTTWKADSKYGTKFKGIADLVDMITVSSVDVELNGFQFLADAARSTSGRALMIDAGLGITQNSIDLRHLYITGQPGDAIEAIKQEQGTIEHVWCVANGGRGFYYHDGGANIGINCTFNNCRAQQNGGTYQWQITNQIGYTFIHPQSLKGAGSTEIFLQSGTSHVLINPDVERTTVAGLGILCSTTKAQIISGTIQKLLNGIQVSSANQVDIRNTRLVGDAVTPMVKGVEYLNSTGTVQLEAAPVNVTTPFAKTNSRVVQMRDSIHRDVNSRAEREQVSPGATYTPDASAGDIKEVTISQATTINGPTSAEIGAVLTFNFIQDGTGGWGVTWNGVFKFNVAWSNAGNVAGTRSTVKFEFDGVNWRQVGQQGVWV